MEYTEYYLFQTEKKKGRHIHVDGWIDVSTYYVTDYILSDP
jgi:hypothetical protein